MRELGYDLGGQQTKLLSQYLGKIHFGIVITVCVKAEEACPTYQACPQDCIGPSKTQQRFKELKRKN
jgi:hypothetical protein